MNTLDQRKREWEEVWEGNFKEMPWFDVPLDLAVLKIVERLPKGEPLIVTGCGSGEHIQKLAKLGFVNIKGFDISEKAITICRKRFANFLFEVASTEELKQSLQPASGHIFDYAIIHHIPPKELPTYMHALDAIGQTLILCYMVNLKKSLLPSRVKKYSPIYAQSPRNMENLLPRHHLVSEASFHMYGHSIHGDPLLFPAICQCYGVK